VSKTDQITSDEWLLCNVWTAYKTATALLPMNREVLRALDTSLHSCDESLTTLSFLSKTFKSVKGSPDAEEN